MGSQPQKQPLTLVQCAVVDHLADTPERERYVDALVRARAKKGLKPEAARELLEDGNYYGTLMTLCAALPIPSKTLYMHVLRGWRLCLHRVYATSADAGFSACHDELLVQGGAGSCAPCAPAQPVQPVCHVELFSPYIRPRPH